MAGPIAMSQAKKVWPVLGQFFHVGVQKLDINV